LEFELAYILGFIFYWVIWCYLLPLLLLGVNGFKSIIKQVENVFGQPKWVGILLLLLPPILAFSTVFISKITNANLIIILVSLVLAIINATGEEILWRGVYIRNFPDSILLGYIYPSLGFALWHISPQTLYSSQMPGGIYSFLIGALFLGLCWGWVSFKTKSIRWSIYSHILTDFLGLGATVYFINLI